MQSFSGMYHDIFIVLREIIQMEEIPFDLATIPYF